MEFIRPSIQAALAKKDFDQAADIAEQRLGLSSLEAHGAAHMAPYMPKPMQDIGTDMHRAASRFARTAQEAAVKGDMSPVFAGLAGVLRQCVACHTTDGTPKIGPTFKGVFGKKETVIHEGKEREITVDEAFIKQTLLHPEIDRVKGFPPLMPSQQGQLTDAEIHEIIEYIKSLK